MYEYLKDTKFLSMLDEMRIKKHYVRLVVLSFTDEKPLREIQGIATAGSITVNGQAGVRRTISLTISGVENENDINNIENIISVNKKVKVEIGLENPFSEYKDYGDIIWFPLGTYVINQATSSTTASSANISISGKDKMCMLDGTCGGTLPSSVTFHESQIEDENGDIQIESVPVFTIIKECVTHFGKEPEQNVIINDVDMTAKLSTKYNGQSPIWFAKDYQSFIISDKAPEDENFIQHKFIYGQDVGYQETDFTYPGELVFAAGDTVTAVLDKIIEQLGNYEYFYDLDGNFVFQQKQNYLNYYYTPITQVNDNYYIKAFSDSKYYYTFIDAKDTLSYYNSPKYENIKNDFIVWGEKTNSEGITKTVQYHLAIDEKPQIDLANQYMWEIKNGKDEHSYYLFEYENNNYNQTPEPKAIELSYNKNSDEIVQDKIKSDIVKDISENVLKNYSFYNNDYFTLYYKIIFLDEIQYYKITLLNHEIVDNVYLEELTDKIDYTYLVYGVCSKKDAEKNDTNTSGDDGSKDDSDGGKTDPSLDPDFGQPSSGGIPSEWWREQASDQYSRTTIDPDFGQPSNPSSGKDDKDDDSSKDDDNKDETTEENPKEFYLLVKQNIDNKNVLGYYDKDGEWNLVYEIPEDFTLDNINNFINNVSSKYYLKIIKNTDFDELTKDYDVSFVDSNYKSNANNSLIAGSKLISYDSNKNKTEYVFIIPTDYEELKDKEDKILLTQEEHNNLIVKLLEYYQKNKNDLDNDLDLIFKYQLDESSDSSSSGDEEGNDTPGPNPDPRIALYDTDKDTSKDNDDNKLENPDAGNKTDKPNLLLPFLDPVEGKKEELKILKDDEDTINKIFILRDYGYDKAQLLEEILRAYNSNVVDFSTFGDNSKIKIITYIPEEPELDYEDNFYFTLIGSPCQEWREELFRQALLNNENGSEKGDYDDELLAKINNEYLWRSQLFDPLNETWHEEWKNQVDNEDEDTWEGWNPAIYIDPSLITYWLDFIDSEQLISRYSVNQIGRRTKAITKSTISMLYKLDVPDVIFFENKGEADLAQKIEKYKLEGQAYCALKPSQMKLFGSSGTGSTAFDYIREMLYQYLVYNLTVTINCTPRYYLEPNNLIYIDDKKSNIRGEFVISQYTLPLTYNGNMSITTNEALVRV